jgi:hydrogenase maturation protein HypF
VKITSLNREKTDNKIFNQGNINIKRRRLIIEGTVQGVGFRPFVYRMAGKYGLKGYVKNSSGDVVIEAQGGSKEVDKFIDQILSNSVKGSRITGAYTEKLQPDIGLSNFVILKSDVSDYLQSTITPDIGICRSCKEELNDPSNMRFSYPFISCTNCGPRFSVQYGSPYDRKNTSMKQFQMCSGCEKEYFSEEDLRFCSEINSCKFCGNQLWLKSSLNELKGVDEKAIERTAKLLLDEKVVAIKGIGGFNIACLASSRKAVDRIRDIKKRPFKPFAVMVKNVKQAMGIAVLRDDESRLLTGKERPIVLLDKKQNLIIDESVAPDLSKVGVMLPNNPVQEMLIKETGEPLVMTSGNLHSEPLIFGNSEAMEKLGSKVDAVLMNDREIVNPLDDSVVYSAGKKTVMIRRARGYVPGYIRLKKQTMPLFAMGSDLKNSFCLANGKKAILSQHIGDLSNKRTMERLEKTVKDFVRIFKIKPSLVVSDLHPDYNSTILADRLGITRIGVQHHFAHIVSCMAEHGLESTVIGVAFDGSGYGEDGTVWGSEFLMADLDSYKRAAHFRAVPMAGGDIAVSKPYRMALSFIYSMFKDDYFELAQKFFPGIKIGEIGMIKAQIGAKINSPETTSCGRLFDAVSALIGLKREVSYEGEAAAVLEAAAAKPKTDSVVYPAPIIHTKKGLIIDTKPLLKRVIQDVLDKENPSLIALRFHRSVANIIVNTCSILRKAAGINEAALSGGVFQNKLLLRLTVDELENQAFKFYFNENVPINDGGIALGQAVAGSLIYQKIVQEKNEFSPNKYTEQKCA